MYDLALSEGLVADPDFERKPINWIVGLDLKGNCTGIEDSRLDQNAGTGRRPYLLPRQYEVPVQHLRTSNDLAFFLVDKAEYVFGIDPSRARSVSKLMARRRLFRNLVASCATSTHDVAVRSVLNFLDGKAAQVDLPKCVLANHLFAFSVGGELVHLRRAVKSFWKDFRESERRSEVPDRTCMITGKACRQSGALPMVKGAPGGRSTGVALASHNFRAAESFGLTGGNNAPIDLRAGEAAVKALSRLLDDAPTNAAGAALPKRFIKLGAEVSLVYWSPASEAATLLEAIGAILQGDADEGVLEKHADRLDRSLCGSNASATVGFALVSGNQSRLVLHDYILSNTKEIARHLRDHFSDTLGGLTPGSALSPPRSMAALRRMVLAAAPLDDPSSPALIAALTRSVLTGTLYPVAYLQAVIARQCEEIAIKDRIAGSRSRVRAASLAAVMNRRCRLHRGQEQQDLTVPSTFDPHGAVGPYAVGAMFAVLARTQTLAFDTGRSTLLHYHFRSIFAAPNSVLPRLTQQLSGWLRAAPGNDPERAKFSALAELIDHFVNGFGGQQGPFPRSCGIDGKAQVLLGYAQMNAWMGMSFEQHKLWKQLNPGAPSAFAWAGNESGSLDRETGQR